MSYVTWFSIAMPGYNPSWQTHRKLVCTTQNFSPTSIRFANTGWYFHQESV